MSEEKKMMDLNEEATDQVPKEHISTSVPEEPKKNNKWNNAGKYVLVCLLAAGCGFGGAYLGTTLNQSHYEELLNEKVAEIQESLENQTPSFGDFGNNMPEMNGDNNMPGMNGDDNFSGDKFGNQQEETAEGAALGVYIQEMDSGIVITGFSEASLADDAGLQTGDIIVELDGNAFDSYDAIAAYISEKQAGDQIQVTVVRASETITVTVELVEKSSSSFNNGMMEFPNTDTSDAIKS